MGGRRKGEEGRGRVGEIVVPFTAIKASIW